MSWHLKFRPSIYTRDPNLVIPVPAYNLVSAGTARTINVDMFSSKSISHYGV